MRLALAAALVASAAPLLAVDEKPASPAPAANAVPMNDAEKAFAETLTGATLTGRFTVDGQAGEPKEERYEIRSASKVGGSDWLVVARVKYGQNDVNVPIPVKVHWAGDTPILSLTDLTIPGLGTFTSRVMFYGDRYAGTWQHGDKGGHLFGTIKKAGDARPAEGGAEKPAGR